MIRIKLYAGLWLAIAVGGLVHHVYLLLVTNARHVTIVTNANQQPTALCIGKGRYRLSQLQGIRHSILEVLLLVFTLTDKRLEILPVIHYVLI